MSLAARIVALEDSEGLGAGGKAEGLARLLAAGLAVPPGFVILDAQCGLGADALVAAWKALGSPRVAVRSSAAAEDGVQTSFAGQYETVLDVEGEDALVQAVEDCVASASSERVKAYASARMDDDASDDAAATIHVVVQTMIAPLAAGVLFSLDPVSGRRDRIVVDAVAGLGEELVSGRATPDHYELNAHGELCQAQLAGAAAVLEPSQLAELCSGALVARSLGDCEVDLEWAIDEAGKLWWLQMRPVTASAPDPRELDYPPANAKNILTRSNIGEMMPGAVTPLTWSVTGYGIEYGLQEMQVRIGVQKAHTANLRFVHMAFGHFFLDLSEMVEMAGAVAGSTREALCVSLCGRDVPELAEPKLRSTTARLICGLRYFRYALAAPRRIRRFEVRGRGLTIEEDADARRLWTEIDRKLLCLWECYDVHLASSTGSGLVAGILERTLAQHSVEERSAIIAELLGGAGDVESAAAAAVAGDVADAIAASGEDAAAFLAMSSSQQVDWLGGAGSGRAGLVYRRGLLAHGHRSLRELEIRQKSWLDDPAPLVAAIAAGLRAKQATHARAKPPSQSSSQTASAYGVSPRIVGWGRDAVRRREYTKSLLVRVTGVFKRGYRRLGVLLEADGILDDADLVFFLTHAELGELVIGRDLSLASKAQGRRSCLDWQMPLVFPEISLGLPEPVVMENTRGVSGDDGALHGRVVSRGRVEGLARVARTLEEASAVQSGEILIAPVTDVGWTPYFATIAGLATDIGSAVSHGAVVAREYGLPAVVNLGTATRAFRTGDRVVLDADAGTLAAAPSQGADTGLQAGGGPATIEGENG